MVNTATECCMQQQAVVASTMDALLSKQKSLNPKLGLSS